MSRIISEFTVDELAEKLCERMQQPTPLSLVAFSTPDTEDIRFYGDSKLAEYLKTSVQTINQLKKRGLPCHRAGRQYYYLRSEVDAWSTLTPGKYQTRSKRGENK